MKTAEINEFSISELTERIQTEKANLQTARLNHAVSPLENTSLLRKARKNIARMMTILAQKQQN